MARRIKGCTLGSDGLKFVPKFMKSEQMFQFFLHLIENKTKHMNTSGTLSITGGVAIRNL